MTSGDDGGPEGTSPRESGDGGAANEDLARSERGSDGQSPIPSGPHSTMDSGAPGTPSEGDVESLARRLLEGSIPRADRHSLELAQPHEAPPMLIQGHERQVLVAAGLELLRVLLKRGGVRGSLTQLDTLRSQLRQSFSSSEWAHLEAEVATGLEWLASSLLEPDATREGDDDRYDPAARIAVVREALSTGRDLLFETRLPAPPPAQNAPPPQPIVTTFRARPLEVTWEEGQAYLAARRVPDGLALEIDLGTVRWIMAVARLTDELGGASPKADVLPFGRRDR